MFVPAGQVALGKLSQSLAYGARTLLVRGDFDACLRLVQEASTELGVYLLNSINPFRLEGQKTIVLELLISWAGSRRTGSCSRRETSETRRPSAKRCARRRPRASLTACHESPRCRPPVQRHSPQASRRRSGSHPTVKAETVATAIKIGDPASWDRAVKTIRETDGVVTAVSDEEILEAKAVIDGAGVGCEPASAASVAGARQLRERGVIRHEDRVVAVLTGHVLKDPGALIRYHQETEPPPRYANRPVEIAADIKAVAKAMGR